MTTLRGMIATVGGSPPPITFSLNGDKPSLVLFIVSKDSRSEVEESILPRLEYNTPQYEYVEVSNHENIESCYSEIRDGITEWLDRRKISPWEVQVDYTGGTKSMAAALVLFSVEDFSEFKYIASYKREKDGIGQGQSGYEYHSRNQNPWNAYAVREIERANWLLENFHADAAAEILEEAAQKCGIELKSRIRKYAGIAKCLARADRFDFGNEEVSLSQAMCPELNELEHLDHTLYKDLHPLKNRWQTLWEQTKRINKTPGEETLLELLANADRRAQQARYDDAVGRLYRVVELKCQQLLKSAFGFDLGKANISDFPSEKRSRVEKILGPPLIGKKGKYKIPLQKGFMLLNLSNNPQIRRQRRIGRDLQKHLNKRNASLLAHGSRPVRSGEYEEFWKEAIQAMKIKDSEIPRWPKINLTL